MIEDFNPFVSQDECTGLEVNQPCGHHIVWIPFNIYEIAVRLNENGGFLGIEEIRINRSFITPEQIKAQGEPFRIDDLYDTEP